MKGERKGFRNKKVWYTSTENQILVYWFKVWCHSHCNLVWNLLGTTTDGLIFLSAWKNWELPNPKIGSCVAAFKETTQCTGGLNLQPLGYESDANHVTTAPPSDTVQVMYFYKDHAINRILRNPAKAVEKKTCTWQNMKYFVLYLRIGK